MVIVNFSCNTSDVVVGVGCYTYISQCLASKSNHPTYSKSCQYKTNPADVVKHRDVHKLLRIEAPRTHCWSQAEEAATSQEGSASRRDSLLSRHRVVCEAAARVTLASVPDWMHWPLLARMLAATVMLLNAPSHSTAVRINPRSPAAKSQLLPGSASVPFCWPTCMSSAVSPSSTSFTGQGSGFSSGGRLPISIPTGDSSCW